MVKQPFPYFGGKSRVAGEVWRRFGDVKNYVEPFCGGAGVLLNRPTHHVGYVETINDAWAFISNFWRAAQQAPKELARLCDWPVNEIDLTARHAWLLDQADDLERKLLADPEWFDAKIAAWWCWGQCSWIGWGWCIRPKRKLSEITARGVYRRVPNVRVDGINRHARPTMRSQGINRRRPSIADEGRGIHRQGRNGTEAEGLESYFRQLAARLRRVRVCCGDWSRVVTPAVTTRFGLTGVFLDPPYTARAGREKNIYAKDSATVGDEVHAWAVANGTNPLLRIAMCGFEGEYAWPAGWTSFAWKSLGGRKSNRERERIWFSPHCLP
ncbi:MAG TPA: DNA adenine methylase [Gemmataceae bacterium]